MNDRPLDIGFTCTRRGMSGAQRHQLVCVLEILSNILVLGGPFYNEPCVKCGLPLGAHGDFGMRDHAYVAPDSAEPIAKYRFHHGDEPHGDKEGAALAETYGFEAVPHPPKTWTAKDLLARDKEIAAVSQLMIAAPRTDKEELRSGTWATVRYARKRLVPVIMLARGIS